MTTRQYSSRSQQSTLTAAITAGSTSIVVVSGTTLLGGVTIPAGRTFTLVIDPDTALEEIVDATAVSTNTFTITRAVDGAPAQAHSAGAVVRHMAIGRDFRDANLHAEADASYNDGAGNAHTMHGIAAGEGVVVGTLKTQTLTNKTLTSPTISNPTFTGTATAEASIVFEGTTADAFETTLTVVDPTQDNTVTIPNTTGTIVIANAVQTLTNKTIDMTGATLTGLSSAGMVATSATPKNYVDAILGSATAAATSATSAATSASSAATSASSAATSATSAAASAVAAANSATTSVNSSIASATSANAAASSATAAAASATAAATSATSATNWAILMGGPVSGGEFSAKYNAGLAATSASSAATSASSAATSASAAATSATSAAASATAAASSAFIADTQGYAASVSASSAAASATAAATSASSAATSASSAAASAAAAAGYVVPSQTGNAGEMLITNGTTTNWSNNVIANTTATVGLIVSAHPSGGQTADLQQWTGASTGSVLAKVESSGSIRTADTFASTLSGKAYIQPNFDTGAIGINTNASGNKGLVIRAVSVGQTANLQEWQNSSGTVLSRIDSAGQGSFLSTTLTASSASGSALTLVAAAGQTANLLTMAGGVNISAGGNIINAPGINANYNMSATAGAAGVIPMVVKGAASQSADLQQWQNSAGTVVANLNPTGVLFVPSVRSTSGTAIAELDLSAGLLVKHSTAANTALRVQNTNASPSGDLQQFLDTSGNILNSIDNNGNIRSEAQLVQYGAEGSLLQNIPTRVHPAETLLKQAVWWIDSAHSSASAQTIRNLGWGGTALDVTNGSSTSADSNDAKYLDWDGTNYVYTPGTAYNYISVADSAPLDITGDIDIRLRLAMDDWTDSSAPIAISKWNSTGNQKSYLLRFLNGGGLRFAWTTDGNVSITRDSTASVPFTDGTVGWVRATLDVDNGASGHDVKFFTSNDGITWTQLGNTVTTAGITSIYSGTASILIGGNEDGSALPIAAKQYRAQILNGIDGVPVLDIDTSVVSTGAATSFTALTGQTVFINRSTSGRKTVCVTNPLWLFGTDDYMEVNNRWLEHTGSNYLYLPGVAGNYASAPDSAALDITGDIDIRCKVALDDWTPASASTLIGKLNATGNQKSYRLTILTDGRLFLQWSADGSAESSAASTVAPTVTDGSTLWIRAALDVDNGASGNTTTFYTSTDGTTWTQLGNTVTNAGVTSIYNSTSILEVGSHSSGASSPARGKFFRAQVLNGIGGTVAFDANFETGITSNLPTTFTESSANAATVTVNYSGTGYRSAGVIASTYVYPGNPNTFKLSTTSLLDFGVTDSFSMLAIVKQWATPVNVSQYLAKRDQNADFQGYGLGSNGTSLSARFTTDLGTPTEFTVNTATFTAGQALVLVGTFAAAGNMNMYLNGTASTPTTAPTTGVLRNFKPLTVGALQGPGFFQDFELVGAAIWRRALTASEIAILNNYFQGRIGG